MSVDLLPAPAPADGTRFDWGIVSSTDPLTVRLNGAGVAVDVANRAREASLVDAGDRVLLMRTGYGGYTYVDRIVDVLVRPTPDTPITSLQPAPVDLDTGDPTMPTAPPVDPTTGELPRFLPLNAPSNVLIADILWDRFTVTYDYTRNTDPNHPVETGFQVNIIRIATGEVVQSEVVSAATRSVRVGSLVGSVFYRAEVRAITTPEAAFTTYNVAQLQYILSATGHQLSSLYSPWARSPQAQTDDPPVSGVTPPINVRWGSVLKDSAIIEWDYQPAPTIPPPATATGFQVRACLDSIGTDSCQLHLAGPDARKQRVTPLTSRRSYWGFVRTVAGSRFSNWVPIGPPRRTLQDFTPEIRNFTLRRIGTTDDVQLSAEIRNATEFRFHTSLTLTRDVLGLETPFGEPLEIFYNWQTITSDNTIGGVRQEWIPIRITLPNAWRARGNYVVNLTARNQSTETTATAQLLVRGLPLFLQQRVVQVGNRGLGLLLFLVGLLPFGGGAGSQGLRAAATRGGALLRTQLRGNINRIRDAYQWSGQYAGRLGFYRAVGVGTIRSLRTQGRFLISRQAGQAFVYRTAAQGGPVIGSSLVTLSMVAYMSYIGWETLEWEVGVRAGPGLPYSRDFFGTFNRSDFPDLGVGGIVEVSRSINRTVYDILITPNYYSPGSVIRLRSRASNSAGTTPWRSSFVTPNDFARVTEGPPTN